VRTHYESDVFVIAIPSRGATYAELVARVERKIRLCGSVSPGDLGRRIRMSWRDDNGDYISVAGDEDVAMAFEAAKRGRERGQLNFGYLVKTLLDLDNDALWGILIQLDPRSPIGRLTLYGCIFTSTTLFSLAAPILWSSNDAMLDASTCQISSIAAGKRSTTSDFRILSSRQHIDTAIVGSAAWRSALYLRLTLSLRINLQNAVVYVNPFADLTPPIRVQHLEVDCKPKPGLGMAETEACDRRWIKWALELVTRSDGPRELKLGWLSNSTAMMFRAVRSIRRLTLSLTGNNIKGILEGFPGLEAFDVGYSAYLMDG
ncbi:hypothetical protein HK101_005292, partial [Irineochytrium annulatum]